MLGKSASRADIHEFLLRIAGIVFHHAAMLGVTEVPGRPN